jgi:type ISP restriction-modification system protein
MPWQSPGVKPNRTWVRSPSAEILRARWDRLIKAGGAERGRLLKETPDRSASAHVRQFLQSAPHSGPLSDEASSCPVPVRVAFRAFDRQYLIPDARVIDRPRPELWQVASEKQVFVVESHDQPVASGPGLLFTAQVPDMHYFSGRGGRVLPLYRDQACLAPNLAPGLLRLIAKRTGVAPAPAPEDILAYAAGTIAHLGYTARFAADLKTPGIRVPLTADAHLWAEAVSLGEEILWLHTYGERFTDPARGRPLALAFHGGRSADRRA